MSPGARPVRVYLLDDHDLVRRGLRDLLVAARDIHVVGESVSARTATESILALDTDVMVLDLHLQDGSGVEVCRRVRAVSPHVRGLLLTAANDDEAAVAAVLAGAAGYTTKYAGRVDLIGAIRSVGAGTDLMGPELRQRTASRLLSSLEELDAGLRHDDRQLLSLLTHGLTDREIEERLDGDPQEIATRIAALIERTTRSVISSAGDLPTPGRGLGKHRADDR